MEVVWYKLRAQGFKSRFEGICAFGTKDIPLLSSFHIKYTQGKTSRRTDLYLFVQLRAFLFDALRHHRGELCGSKRRIVEVSRAWLAHLALHTLSCSNTASDNHFTLASRARTSTAFRADVDESWLARKQSCSPCCSAFLDCTTSVTRWGLSLLCLCVDIQLALSQDNGGY